VLIINKYLIKEIFTSLLGVAAVLFLIFFSGQLVGLYTKAAAGNLQVDTIMILLGLKSISNLVFVLPLAFYLAVLLAFSRLYRDNEMVVLLACGIGQTRLIMPVLRLALLFGTMIGILSLYLAPWADDKSRQLVQQAESTTDVQMLSAGRFREIPGSKGVIYIEETKEDDGKLRNIFIQRTEDKTNSLIASATGYQMQEEQSGIRYLVLENGFRYEGQPGTEDYVVIRFKKHGMRLTDQGLLSKHKRYKEKSSLSLWQSGTRFDIAELQWRVSTVLLSIILAILAIPLSKTSARQGRYTKLGLALLIYIIYTNLLNVSRVWIEKNEISYAIGMWWVHVVMLFMAISLFLSWPSLKHIFSRHKQRPATS